MVDCREQLDLIDAAVGPRPAGAAAGLPRPRRLAARRPAAGCTSARAARPCTRPPTPCALARAVAGRAGFRLVGLMAYEGQVAGLQDRRRRARCAAAAVRRMQAAVGAGARRAAGAVVAAVREVADLEFVNGGGTGSLESHRPPTPSVTEVAAGSGLYAPALFDGYDAFDARPAAFFGARV